MRADLGLKSWQRTRIPDVPVIYIRALAVREDQQGKGIGTDLLIDAMRRCIGIADQKGAVAIVLDVLKDAAFNRGAEFYEGLGFRPLNDPESPTRVLIPMAEVRATLGHKN